MDWGRGDRGTREGCERSNVIVMLAHFVVGEYVGDAVHSRESSLSFNADRYCAISSRTQN